MNNLETKLLDHKAFHEAFQNELNHRSVLLAKVHISNLAWINAEYGKLVGDEVIISIQKALLDLTKWFCAGQISPSIYGVICLQVTDPQEFLNDIEDAVAQANRAHRWPFLVEVACGVTFADARISTDITGWITQANIAMAASARRGEGVIYQPMHDLQQKIRLELGRQTNLSAPPQGVSWVFQPVFRLTDNQVVGYETLTRWDSPTLGKISPDVFIQVAEDMGLVHMFDAWALEAGCAAVKHLVTTEGQGVSVNVSAKTFEHDDKFVDRIKTAMERHSVKRGQLVIELTETAVIKNIDLMAKAFTSLRDVGVEIAIDDFGKGETNLMNMALLPIDYLKLDAGLLKLPDSGVEKSMIKIGAEIGHALRVTVLCEGVETAADLQLVKNAKVKLAQGYYLGRPEPLDYYLNRD